MAAIVDERALGRRPGKLLAGAGRTRHGSRRQLRHGAVVRQAQRDGIRQRNLTAPLLDRELGDEVVLQVEGLGDAAVDAAELSAPASAAGISPVRELWLRSSTDPGPYGIKGEWGLWTPPEKLFRWRKTDAREGRKRLGGMGPPKRFMLRSRYTKSESDSSPLSGPHIWFTETDT
nr:hypothetical protein DY000_00020404 [Ipomoea batatas]